MKVLLKGFTLICTACLSPVILASTQIWTSSGTICSEYTYYVGSNSVCATTELALPEIVGNVTFTIELTGNYVEGTDLNLADFLSLTLEIDYYDGLSIYEEYQDLLDRTIVIQSNSEIQISSIQFNSDYSWAERGESARYQEIIINCDGCSEPIFYSLFQYASTDLISHRWAYTDPTINEQLEGHLYLFDIPAPVYPVPIPASIMLYINALIGFIAIRRITNRIKCGGVPPLLNY